MELVGYPSGQIVNLSNEIFDEVKDFDEIFYDDDFTKENPNGAYGFNDEDIDIIESFEKFVGSDMPFNHYYLENELSYKEIDEGLLKLYLNGKWVATFEIWVDGETGGRYIAINHTIIYLNHLKELG